MRTLKAPDVIERGDEGECGHGADRRHRRESRHDGMRARDRRAPRVGRGELGLERCPERDQWCQLRAHVRRQREGGELRDGLLGLATREPEAFAAHGRLEERDVARAGAAEGLAHGELRAEVPLGVARPMDRTPQATGGRHHQRNSRPISCSHSVDASLMGAVGLDTLPSWRSWRRNRSIGHAA
jgi:hypothetical protein